MIAALDVFTSDSFLQSLFLLIATAALTGLLVPILKGRLDDRKFREQKVFEADLARQAKVIDAQASLLSDLSDQLWTFLLLGLEVTYYAQQRNQEKFEAAWRVYDDEAWSYFGKIRAEISKARRLASAETHADLQRVYREWFMGFDARLVAQVASGRDLADESWLDLHAQVSGEGAELVDDVLNRLAEELRLTQAAPAAHRTAASPSSALTSA